MPYVGPDSLETVLGSPHKYSWLTLTSKTVIIVGITIGMYVVHCGGIIHRDLRPANVLLDPISHYPKITDFGLSRQANANTTEREGGSTLLSLTPGLDKTMAMTGSVGSRLYMAPEVIEGRGYSSKADVFSFGIFLYEIVTGKPPCQGCGDNTVSSFCRKVTAGDREEIPDTVRPFTESPIRRCWDHDPHMRPTFLEISDELRKNGFHIFSSFGLADFLIALRSTIFFNRSLFVLLP
jgi:serine/threonine-protein kinase